METGGRLMALAVLAGAGVVGTVVGVGSAGRSTPVVDTTAKLVGDVAVASGIKRLREPQPGDRWDGCNAVRAVGSAPIYRGEPGYSPDMDGDGIACEPRPD